VLGQGTKKEKPHRRTEPKEGVKGAQQIGDTGIDLVQKETGFTGKFPKRKVGSLEVLNEFLLAGVVTE